MRKGRELQAFLNSSSLIAGLLATGAAALFPVMLLPSIAWPRRISLTAAAVASTPGSLWIAMIWWPVAFLLAVFYAVFISRRYAGKVRVSSDNQGYY